VRPAPIRPTAAIAAAFLLACCAGAFLFLPVASDVEEAPYRPMRVVFEEGYLEASAPSEPRPAASGEHAGHGGVGKGGKGCEGGLNVSVGGENCKDGEDGRSGG